MRRFPVHWGMISREERAEWERLGCPRDVPWEFLEPHEAQAKRNHDQSLQRLAERGGLGPNEMLLVLEGRSLRSILSAVDAIPLLLDKLRAWGDRG